MRFLSLFSGIEAASVAFNPLGWQCAAVAEIEPFPCALLAHHYPTVPNLGDVTKVTREQVRALGPLDIVCGGFPCQDLSVAGKRQGMKHADGTSTRSGLFFDAMRIAEWADTRWLLIENVPGMFSSNRGRDFAAVVGEMAGCEFDVPTDGWANAGVVVGPLGLVEWTVLDAQYHGLAQRRKRVFLVRDSGDWRSRPPLFLEPYRLQGHPAPSRQTGQKVANSLVDRPDRGGGNSEGQRLIAGTMKSCKDSGGWSNSADHAGPTVMQPFTLAIRGRGDGRELEFREDGTANALLTPNGGRDGIGVVAIAFDCKASGQNGFGVGEIASTQRAMGHAGSHTNGGGHQAVAYSTKLHNTTSNQAGKVYEEYAAGLDSNSPPPALLTTMQVRRLTPRECERLMGFPDDYTLIPLRNKKPSDVIKFAADGPRYKALGNSWAVPCARWIGERIEAVEAIHAQQRKAA